jgi:hypothetical protein
VGCRRMHVHAHKHTHAHWHWHWHTYTARAPSARPSARPSTHAHTSVPRLAQVYIGVPGVERYYSVPSFSFSSSNSTSSSLVRLVRIIIYQFLSLMFSHFTTMSVKSSSSSSHNYSSYYYSSPSSTENTAPLHPVGSGINEDRQGLSSDLSLTLSSDATRHHSLARAPTRSTRERGDSRGCSWRWWWR